MSSFHRDGAWAFYILMNFLALYFNSSLIVSVYRLKDKKSSTDILIGGLASGIIIGALGCGPQCLFSIIMSTFAFGERACFIEAYLHIVGMIIQFLSVSAISYRTYIGVVKLQSFDLNKAYFFVVAIWCLAFAGTLLFGTYSPIYLVASGTFCFYQWTSLALIAWAWPVAISAAIGMGFCYYKTFKTVSEVRKGAKDIYLDGSSREAAIALKLSVLVFLFVLGYSGIVSQSLYEVFIGRAKIWGDVIAAVIVLIYWVSAPWAYAHVNNRLGSSSVIFCRPSATRKTGSRNSSTNGSADSRRHYLQAESSPWGSNAHQKEQIEFVRSTSPSLSGTTAVMLKDAAYCSDARGTSRMEGAPQDAYDASIFVYDGSRPPISPRSTSESDNSPCPSPSPRSPLPHIPEDELENSLLVSNQVQQPTLSPVGPPIFNPYTNVHLQSELVPINVNLNPNLSVP